MARGAQAPGGFGNLAQMSELKARLLFVLGAMLVFRIGAHIPVPGIDPVALADMFNSQQTGILDIFVSFN